MNRTYWLVRWLWLRSLLRRWIVCPLLDHERLEVSRLGGKRKVICTRCLRVLEDERG